MDGACGKLDAVFLGADVGRKLDFIAAAFQLLRQRPPAARRKGRAVKPPAP
jgi:hypothetical protein